LEKSRFALTALLAGLLMVLPSSIVLPAHANDPTVFTCGTLTTSGTFNLAAGFSSSPLLPDGHCLDIAPGTGGSVTLNLSGQSLIGPCPGTAFTAGIAVLSGSATILGPGTISNWETGIGVGGPASNGIIGPNILVLSNCGAGIGLGNTMNNLVTGDTISGNGIGIFIDGGSLNSIRGNVITGNLGGPRLFSTLGGGAGIEIHVSGGATIGGSPSQGNTITGNTNGIYMDGFSGGATISNNIVDFNTHFGLVTNAGGNTITGNDFSNNGVDGIQVAGSFNALTHNTVNSNGRRGIVIGNTCAGIAFGSGGTGFSTGNGDTIGGSGMSKNTATLNGLILPSQNPGGAGSAGTSANVDYYWDGQGTGNTWPRDSATFGLIISLAGPGMSDFFTDASATEPC